MQFKLKMISEVKYDPIETLQVENDQNGPFQVENDDNKPKKR